MSMRLVKYDKFLETVLSIPLLRTSKKDGEQRGDVLVKKLKEEEPKLTLNNGEPIEIDNAKELTNAITNNKGEYDDKNAIDIFVSDKNRYLGVIKSDGEEYKLNQFKKDKDFGSSGAGVNTRNYENLQCIFLAHKLVRPDVELTDVNIVRLLEEYNDSGSDIAKKIHLHLLNIEKVDDFLMYALESPDWASTLKDVTQDLYDFKSRNVSLFKSGFTGKYHVYHISCKEMDSPFKILRDKFKYLLNKSGLESNLSIEFSKYCPADVIVSLDYVNLTKVLSSVETMDQMTDLLNDLFTKRLFIPISLKKVGVTVNSIKTYSIIVNNEFERPLPEFETESFIVFEDIERGIGSRIKVKSSWKDAKGNEIDGEDRVLTIDSANTSNRLNVDGEVEGKFSRHGKISFLYMKYFIESVIKDNKIDNLQVLEQYSDLEKLSEKILSDRITSILIKLNDITNQNKSIIIKYPHKPGTKISTGRPIGENNRKNKLISKLQSLQIILVLIEIRLIDINLANDIINKIIRYALSIQADLFITPRYVRVI